MDTYAIELSPKSLNKERLQKKKQESVSMFTKTCQKEPTYCNHPTRNLACVTTITQELQSSTTPRRLTTITRVDVCLLSSMDCHRRSFLLHTALNTESNLHLLLTAATQTAWKTSVRIGPTWHHTRVKYRPGPPWNMQDLCSNTCCLSITYW